MKDGVGLKLFALNSEKNILKKSRPPSILSKKPLLKDAQDDFLIDHLMLAVWSHYNRVF